MIPTPVLTQFFKKFQLRRFCFVGQYTHRRLFVISLNHTCPNDVMSTYVT
jgi:hypothetical protein